MKCSFLEETENPDGTFDRTECFNNADVLLPKGYGLCYRCAYRKLQAENKRLICLAEFVLNTGIISKLQAMNVSGLSLKEIEPYMAKSEAEADEIIKRGE